MLHTEHTERLKFYSLPKILSLFKHNFYNSSEKLSLTYWNCSHLQLSIQMLCSETVSSRCRLVIQQPNLQVHQIREQHPQPIHPTEQQYWLIISECPHPPDSTVIVSMPMTWYSNRHQPRCTLWNKHHENSRQYCSIITATCTWLYTL